MKNLEKLEINLHNARKEYRHIFHVNRNNEDKELPANLDQEKEKLIAFESVVEKLQQYSKENDVYTRYCDISFYELSYSERLNNFLIKNVDSVERDFIKMELNIFKSVNKKFDRISNPFHFSDLRKKEFLKEKLEILKKQARPTKSSTPFSAIYIFKALGIIEFLHDSKGIKYDNIVKLITVLIGKSEGSIRKEMNNRASITSRTNKVASKRLDKWIKNEILEQNDPT